MTEISYDKLLYFFENDHIYPIDETIFYFDDESKEDIHYIGCIRERKSRKPNYWAGYCDIPDGCDFPTAKELFTAKIYNNQSIEDRWKHLVLVEIGGVSVEYWIKTYLLDRRTTLVNKGRSHTVKKRSLFARIFLAILGFAASVLTDSSEDGEALINSARSGSLLAKIILVVTCIAVFVFTLAITLGITIAMCRLFGLPETAENTAITAVAAADFAGGAIFSLLMTGKVRSIPSKILLVTVGGMALALALILLIILL